MLLVLAHKN